MNIRRVRDLSVVHPMNDPCDYVRASMWMSLCSIYFSVHVLPMCIFTPSPPIFVHKLTGACMHSCVCARLHLVSVPLDDSTAVLCVHQSLLQRQQVALYAPLSIPDPEYRVILPTASFVSIRGQARLRLTKAQYVSGGSPHVIFGGSRVTRRYFVMSVASGWQAM